VLCERVLCASMTRGAVNALLALVLASSDALSVGSAPHSRRAFRRSHQPGEPRMAVIEAYDLVPMLSCLDQSSSYTGVLACFDTLSPWLQITDDGVVFSETAVAGFLGGTVGVIGTVTATFIKRDEVKERLKCPYCEGSGQLACGTCLGLGTISMMEGEEMVTKTCPQCEGTGTVVCINCQGSGVSVPEDILQKLGDSEVGFTEEDYIGLFDEVKFPTIYTENEVTHTVKAAPSTADEDARELGVAEASALPDKDVP
jgi:hypothetical protein